MTYTITAIPQAVTQDNWGVTSVYNDGPSSVYLGEGSSVSPQSGVLLPPKSNTTWQAGYPLWACVASGDLASEITLNRAGTAINDFRTRLGSLLLSRSEAVAGYIVFPEIDVTAYDTLELYWKQTDYDLADLDNVASLILLWDSGTSAEMTSYLRSNNGFDNNRITTPVKGNKVEIVLALKSGGGITAAIVGSIGRGASITNSAQREGVRAYLNKGASEYFTYPKYAYIKNYSVTGRYQLPSAGETLTITVSGSQIVSSETGSLELFDRESGVTLGVMDIPADIDNYVITKRFTLPTDVAIALKRRVPFTSPNPINVALIWS